MFYGAEVSRGGGIRRFLAKEDGTVVCSPCRHLSVRMFFLLGFLSFQLILKKCLSTIIRFLSRNHVRRDGILFPEKYPPKDCFTLIEVNDVIDSGRVPKKLWSQSGLLA